MPRMLDVPVWASARTETRRSTAKTVTTLLVLITVTSNPAGWNTDAFSLSDYRVQCILPGGELCGGERLCGANSPTYRSIRTCRGVAKFKLMGREIYELNGLIGAVTYMAFYIWPAVWVVKKN